MHVCMYRHKKLPSLHSLCSASLVSLTENNCFWFILLLLIMIMLILLIHCTLNTHKYDYKILLLLLRSAVDTDTNKTENHMETCCSTILMLRQWRTMSPHPSYTWLAKVSATPLHMLRAFTVRKLPAKARQGTRQLTGV